VALVASPGSAHLELGMPVNEPDGDADLVNMSVVEPTQQDAVVDGRVSAVGPADDVVCFAPAGRPVAAGVGAALVALCEGDALLLAVQSFRPAQIERDGRSVHHGGDDAGAA